MDPAEDTDLDLLRDRLLMQALRGEITKEQAEATAAARGFAPFETRPELPQFDPKRRSHWSIVMAVAWIAWRDFELVREQDPEFCSKSIRWSRCTWREPPIDGSDPSAGRSPGTDRPDRRDGWVLEEPPQPTIDRLVLSKTLKKAKANLPPTAVMTIREAVAALWYASAEGHLSAEGFNAVGAVVEIPSREWAHLRLFREGGRDVLRYTISGAEPFTAIKFRQSDLLRLWPVAADIQTTNADIGSLRWAIAPDDTA